MRDYIHRQKWFNTKTRRILRKWLLRIAVIGVASDALAVFGFRLALTHDPAFGEQVTKCLHISGAFGSLCGACALLVSETQPFFD